jgi:predicted TIM-barrel fold metal-dependent hydrolase
MAPLSKVVYGSDGYGAPEINYISAKLAKQAIGQALGVHVDDGFLSEVEAQQAAGFILAENARRLYKLDL